MAARNCLRLLARAVTRPGASKYAPGLLERSTFETQNSIIQYHSLRCINTSFPPSNLAQVLRDELKYEKENYQPAEPVKLGPPSPFTLVDSPEDTLITLKHKHNGEDVSIDLHVNNQPDSVPEDADDNAEELSIVAFNVTVTKNDKSLVFAVESDGTYINIVHVSFEPKGGEVSDAFYHGPVFAELDETLQAEFKEYLSARGVNSDVGEYLRHLISDKEEQQYQLWLQKVHNFVS